MAIEPDNPLVGKIVIDYYRDGRVKVMHPTNEILALGILQKAIRIVEDACKNVSTNIQIVPPIPKLDDMEG